MTRYLAAGLAAVFALPAAAQPPKADDPVGRTLRAWEARQRKVKTARYVVTGTTEWLMRTYPTAPVPAANDRVRPFRIEVVLDLEKGRFRCQRRDETLRDDGTYRPSAWTSTFDGRESRDGRPLWEERVAGAFDLSITPLRRPDDVGDVPNFLLYPLLFAHGLVPGADGERGFARLPWTYDRGDYVAAGRHPLGGRVCDVIRTEPLESDPPLVLEYWVDPARDGAIVRYGEVSGDRPEVPVEIAWRPTPAGWGVAGWTKRFWFEVRRYQVESAEFDGPVADAEFTIPAEPGMERVIVDVPHREPGMIVPARRVYRITEGGRWEELEGEPGLSARGVIPAPPPQWGGWQWAAVAGGAAAVGVMGWWAWRRRRSPARPVPPVP